ncbi:MAG: hypothetical protein WKF87_06830 [Chryseolinea sp.]
MMQTRKLGSKTFISSLDLYNQFGRASMKYHNWIIRYVIRNQTLAVPHDYFIYRKTRRGKGGNPLDLYLSNTLAKSLCIREGTFTAKRVKQYIENVIDM